MAVKLVRTYSNKVERVTVPPELEGFVTYMLSRGYKESTVAVIIMDLRMIMNRGLSERELELMSGKVGRRFRYAWRHYKRWRSEA